MCNCSRPETIQDIDVKSEVEDKKELFKIVNGTTEIEKKQEIVYSKEWTQKESELLVQNYYDNKIKNWKKLSEIIQTKSPQQICYKIKKIEEKAKMKSFTRQDDLLIMKCVEIYGKNWDIIANSFPSFTANMIEERYSNKLDPNLKRTKFTSDEDEKIICLYEKYGNSWKEIAAHFPDRNSGMIKNRFYSVLKKRIPHSIKSSSMDTNSLVNSILNSNDENQFDYLSNQPQQFNYQLNEHCNNKIDSDITMSDLKQEIYIDSKSNNLMVCDNDSNNSGGISPVENMSNNISVDNFNEIYQKVFPNDLEKKQELEIYDNNGYTYHNDCHLFVNENNHQLPFEIFNSKNSTDGELKIDQTDDLFVESQRLEEILTKIDGEYLMKWENSSIFLSVESDNKQFNDLIDKKEKLTKWKEKLHLKLKQLKNEFLQLKNNNLDNNIIPQMFTQNLHEINDVLLKLISIGKMKIILHKQIFDYLNRKNSNGI